MGKRTQAAKGAQSAAIRKHVEWATGQEPIVGALVAHTKGCHVYGLAPTEEADPGKFNYHPVARFVLVPPVSDGDVVIPAGHMEVNASPDRSRRVILHMTPPGEHSWYVQVGEGLEIVHPGGSIATLRRNELGIWMVVDPPENPVPEPS